MFRKAFIVTALAASIVTISVGTSFAETPEQHCNARLATGMSNKNYGKCLQNQMAKQSRLKPQAVTEPVTGGEGGRHRRM
jgi:hypothetical protein